MRRPYQSYEHVAPGRALVTYNYCPLSGVNQSPAHLDTDSSINVRMIPAAVSDKARDIGDHVSAIVAFVD